MAFSKKKSNSNPMHSIKKPANILAVKSVSISYPPLESTKGSAFLSQNRQFQWTNTGNVIYPIIPAYAATLLQSQGIKIFWDDAIAQKLTFSDWLKRLKQNHPDLIVIETKTPVIKKHWQIIKQIKKECQWNPIVILIGDHVTALPQESIENCPVDYVIIGGDYDFLLSELVNLINQNKAPKNKVFKLQKEYSLDSLPIIDRKLTQWQLYAYNNTNYKYKPGSYIMSGRDCWWGQCTFCSWTTLFPGKCFRSFSVKHTIAEIENLVNNFGVKEIFDDSGTLPIGPWLKNLCQQLITKGLNKKVTLGCNMRFGALSQEEYFLMKKAGFRFILYGLESANQKTLNFVNKNEKTSSAIDTLKMAKKAKLEPHVTVMIGYPNESFKDAQKTLSLARFIFRENLADSLQATILIPYPGTPLFDYCQKNNLLLTNDWDDFDMRQPIIKSSILPQEQITLVQNLFKGILTPNFIFKKLISIRSLDDVKHLSNYAFKYIKKLKDFTVSNNNSYDWEHLIEGYKKIVKKNDIVLEIGASTPKRTEELSKYCKKVVGVEYFKERLPKSHNNIIYILEDWQKLTNSIAKNSIDLAVSSHVIEHVPDDLKALNELYDVLKPNSQAIITTPNRQRLTRRVIELFTGKRKFPYWEHIREYIEPDLIKLISKSKFKKYKITPLVFGVLSGRYQLFFKKVPKIFRKLANFWEINLYK
jgi:radical SAM superfamily enzyme YgiQ (UPF0313 family)